MAKDNEGTSVGTQTTSSTEARGKTTHTQQQTSETQHVNQSRPLSDAYRLKHTCTISHHTDTPANTLHQLPHKSPYTSALLISHTNSSVHVPVCRRLTRVGYKAVTGLHGRDDGEHSPRIGIGVGWCDRGGGGGSGVEHSEHLHSASRGTGRAGGKVAHPVRRIGLRGGYVSCIVRGARTYLSTRTRGERTHQSSVGQRSVQTLVCGRCQCVGLLPRRLRWRSTRPPARTRR